MIRQLVYPEAALPVIWQGQVFSFLQLTWPEGFYDDPQPHPWLTHPANHPLHFILADCSHLMSHAQVEWKYLAHAGQEYQAYGLGGVFTRPDYRGRGYGRQLVEAATAYIRQSEADVAMLWCEPSLKGFYTRLGWSALEQAITLIGPPELPRRYPLLLMMMFLSAHGRAGQAAFATLPIYFGAEAW
jgi:GNAT superfamily N-acetyltransferase